jgi:hypothetical protein
VKDWNPAGRQRFVRSSTKRQKEGKTDSDDEHQVSQIEHGVNWRTEEKRRHVRHSRKKKHTDKTDHCGEQQ